jgi:hypothetical protein
LIGFFTWVCVHHVSGEFIVVGPVANREKRAFAGNHGFASLVLSAASRTTGYNQMKRTILGFSGIKPVRISSFGPVKISKKPNGKNGWWWQHK